MVACSQSPDPHLKPVDMDGRSATSDAGKPDFSSIPIVHGHRRRYLVFVCDPSTLEIGVARRQ